MICYVYIDILIRKEGEIIMKKEIPEKAILTGNTESDYNSETSNGNRKFLLRIEMMNC